MPNQGWVQEVAAQNSGPFVAVTAAAITALCPDVVIPGGVLLLGSKYRAHLWGKMSTAASSQGTAVFALNWGGTGGTALATSAAITLVASATNLPWQLEYEFWVQAISNAVPPLLTIQAMGKFTTVTGILATPGIAFIPASAPAQVGSLSNSAQSLDFSITLSAATNSITCLGMSLESVGL